MSRATDTGAAPSRWVVAGTALAALLCLLTPLGAWLSLPFVDAQARWAGRDNSPPGVIVVDIDDASLRELQPRLGSYPFPRDAYALAVEALRGAGARAIAIDLVLGEPGPADRALARTLARPGAPVVLAAAGLRPSMGPGLPPAATDGRARPYPWPDLVLPSATLWPAPDRPPPTGVVTTPLDADGRLRRMPLWHEARGRILPALPLAVWQTVDAAAAGLGVAAGLAPPRARAWPLDAAGRAVVPVPAPRDGLPVMPFAAVVRAALGLDDGSALAQAVHNQVVFVGSSALLGDSVLAAGGQVSGTVVLAHLYAALRDDTLLAPPAASTDLPLLAIALLPVLWTWRRGHVRPLPDLAATALAAAGVAGLGLALLEVARVQTQWGAPLATLAVGALLTLAAHQRALVRAQRRLAYERAVAAAASQAKSEFLANVSHEIRTPMNALLGVAELLARTPLDNEQRRHVDVFRSSGQALFELINDLLDLSKIEAGRLELHVAPFALRPLLEERIALLWPRAHGKGLVLELALAEGLPTWVHGDGPRLAQALTNLIGNAIKFTLQGRVRLEVAPGDAADELRFVVSDTGIGIAPSKLESIFEPFTQVDGSVTRTFGGTGLGLSITRSLVRLMGGRIEVASDPGHGSTFTLCLPLPAAAPPAAAAASDVAAPPGLAEPPVRAAALPRRAGADTAARRAAPSPAPPAAPAAAAPVAGVTTSGPASAATASDASTPPLAVLLAEDNEVNVYLFRAMLADADCAIDVAGNGHAAVEQWRRRHYDIVFMDVQMPGMDGHAATRAIRALEAETGRPRVPIVALSAHAFDSDRQASLEAGCDRHLTKPTSRDALRAVLDEARRHSAARGTAVTPDRPERPGPAPLDDDDALRRAGGDPLRRERLRQHAAVFLPSWGRAYDVAQAQRDAQRLLGLAQDLHSVAGHVGAGTLADAARRLVQALTAASAASAPSGTSGTTSVMSGMSDGAAAAVAEARAAVDAALAPAIVELTRSDDMKAQRSG